MTWSGDPSLVIRATERTSLVIRAKHAYYTAGPKRKRNLRRLSTWRGIQSR